MNNNKKEKLIWELENNKITLDEIMEECYTEGERCQKDEGEEYQKGFDNGYDTRGDDDCLDIK